MVRSKVDPVYQIPGGHFELQTSADPDEPFTSVIVRLKTNEEEFTLNATPEQLFRAAKPLDFSALPKKDLCWIKKGNVFHDGHQENHHYGTLMIRNTFLVPQLAAFRTHLPRRGLFEGKDASLSTVKDWLLARQLGFETQVNPKRYPLNPDLKLEDISTVIDFIDYHLQYRNRYKDDDYPNPNHAIHDQMTLQGIYRQIDGLIVVKLQPVTIREKPHVTYLVFKADEARECKAL
ncbi:MAG: hypothetical protein AB7F59_13040 [Bdellovibrionales bacterium]